MKKGITLSLEELIALRDILNESDLETILAESIEEKTSIQGIVLATCICTSVML